MIVWKGFGILIPVLAFLAVFCGQLVQDALGFETPAGQDLSMQAALIWRTIPLFIASVIIWFLGKQLNKKHVTTYTDGKTGEEVEQVRQEQHSLFFIPFQYWAPIVALFAAAMPYI